jgi:hypothetical protein
VEDAVEVYGIDNCSTGGTAEIARQWLGNGVIKVERTAGKAVLEPTADAIGGWLGSAVECARNAEQGRGAA